MSANKNANGDNVCSWVDESPAVYGDNMVGCVV